MSVKEKKALKKLKFKVNYRSHTDLTLGMVLISLRRSHRKHFCYSCWRKVWGIKTPISVQLRLIPLRVSTIRNLCCYKIFLLRGIPIMDEIEKRLKKVRRNNRLLQNKLRRLEMRYQKNILRNKKHLTKFETKQLKFKTNLNNVQRRNRVLQNKLKTQEKTMKKNKQNSLKPERLIRTEDGWTRAKSEFKNC